MGGWSSTTPRLWLRPFAAPDFDAAHAVYADPEVMRWVGHGAHRTTAETRSALRGYADALAVRGYGFVAVVERSSGDADRRCGPPSARRPRPRHRGRLHARALGLGPRLRDRGGAGARRARVRARSARRGSSPRSSPTTSPSRHVLEKLGMTERATRIAYGRPHLLYGVEREDYVPAAPVGDAQAPPGPDAGGSALAPAAPGRLAGAHRGDAARDAADQAVARHDPRWLTGSSRTASPM